MQLLPNAKTQFIDQNGLPLAGGTVGFYFPGTLNPKATYQDSAGTIANTNPIALDSRGQALIWGSGTYRQIVQDASGVTIWDQITEDPNAGLTGNITDKKYVSGTDFTPGTTTVLTLPVTPGASTNMWVFFDAAYQGDDQYAVSGTTLTFNSPIPVGVQEVNVKIGTTVAVGVPASGTVTDDTVSSGAGIQSSKLSFTPGLPGTVTRTIQKKLSEYLTVLDYGAKGDGVTDDTAAFQAAINSGVCRIPYSPNGYMIKTALNATNLTSLVIQGVGCIGPQWSLGYTTPQNTYGSLIIANTGGWLLDITGSNNVTIRDLTISSVTLASGALSNPSTGGIIGGTSTNASTLNAPGGSGYTFENVSIWLAKGAGNSIPIYVNNGNIGRYTNISTVGSFGICLTSVNPLNATPPFASFGTISQSDNNIISGAFLVGYGNQPVMYFEEANDLTVLETYHVFGQGLNGGPYSGPGYSTYINNCENVDMKLEVDYFPYMFQLAGTATRVNISGIMYQGATTVGAGVPGIGYFAGSFVKNCKFDVVPAASLPNNNYLYSSAGSSPTLTLFANCDFWFDTGFSSNVAFLNTNNANPVPFFNCSFRSNTDVGVPSTPLNLLVGGSGATASQYRLYMNGKLFGTA